MVIETALRTILRDGKRKLFWSTRVASLFNRFLVMTFGIRVNLDKSGSAYSPDKNYLIVSNHLSYLDIFILFSEFPATFIASVDEVKESFLLGRVTELSGGFFVERRNRAGLRAEIESIAGILRMGINVALFPEGTTSNGDGVLPFKTPILSVAERAGVDILPVCIRYTKIDGEDIGPHNRDLVYYYGDMKFFEHCGKLLGVRSIDVEVKLLKPIDAASASSRKDLAREVYETISSAYTNGRTRERA